METRIKIIFQCGVFIYTLLSASVPSQSEQTLFWRCTAENIAAHRTVITSVEPGRAGACTECVTGHFQLLPHKPRYFCCSWNHLHPVCIKRVKACLITHMPCGFLLLIIALCQNTMSKKVNLVRKWIIVTSKERYFPRETGNIISNEIMKWSSVQACGRGWERGGQGVVFRKKRGRRS